MNQTKRILEDQMKRMEEYAKRTENSSILFEITESMVAISTELRRIAQSEKN